MITMRLRVRRADAVVAVDDVIEESGAADAVVDVNRELNDCVVDIQQSFLGLRECVSE